MTEAPITLADTGIAPLREEGEPRHRIPVVMSGLGKMGTLVAEAISYDDHFDLQTFALSSENHFHQTRRVGEHSIVLWLTDRWPNNVPEGTIVIDYSKTDAVLGNVEFYVSRGLPFIMGTSTGNAERLRRITEMVANSDISAVIAPNMDPSVVKRQMDIDNMAQINPDLFAGATVRIMESHQATKVDASGNPITSGTAIAFAEQFEGYGTRLARKIRSVRTPSVQRSLGIPEEYLDAHAYHWVTVTKNGRKVYGFETKVNGRQSYVDGTLIAAKFLPDQEHGHVFTMADALRGGEQNK